MASQNLFTADFLAVSLIIERGGNQIGCQYKRLTVKLFVLIAIGFKFYLSCVRSGSEIMLGIIGV
jgi:hypothetical protein